MDYAWDFDGTLFDSYPHIIRSMKLALLDCGLHDSDEHIASLVVVTVRVAVDYYKKERGATEELMERFRVHNDIIDCDSVVPFPGVREALSFIKENNGRNMLFTHRNNRVFDYLDHYDMTKYFSFSVTGDDRYKRKPAPDGLNLLMEKSRSLPSCLVMVGDRPIDIESAWNAGCRSVFFNSNGLPVPPHATWSVDDYASFLNLAGKIREL